MTPHPRSSGCVGAGGPSYSTFKVRRGSGEEITLIQDKEQQLCFAGAAVNRYPTSKVRETRETVGVARGHQRADTLKP